MAGFPNGGNLRTLLVNAVKVTAAIAFISYVAINWLASGRPVPAGALREAGISRTADPDTTGSIKQERPKVWVPLARP